MCQRKCVLTHSEFEEFWQVEAAGEQQDDGDVQDWSGAANPENI